MPVAPNRPLKILSIAPTSFFGDYGCHVRILEEARALKMLGHEVTILTYYKGDDAPGFRIIRTAPTPWHGNYEVGSSRHKLAFDILLAIRLGRVLVRNKFDIIHGHLHEGALIASVMARPWRIPVCFDYQGSLTSEMLDHGFLHQKSKALALWKYIERLAERLPAHIFTSTVNAAETLRAVTPNLRIQALPDGVNTDVFTPTILTESERISRRLAFGFHHDDTVIVYLGLLAKHQGIGCLIETAALMKAQGSPVKWLIMGYPGVEYWKTISATHGVLDRITFTGRIPYANAPQMLALGDIAVAPKLSRTEGSGKILNYMAMALPTVAFNTTAQSELLGSQGVFAQVGNVEQLAERIQELVDQPERRHMIGQSARARAIQFFGWNRAGVILETTYRSLLARSRGLTLLATSESDTVR